MQTSSYCYNVLALFCCIVIDPNAYFKIIWILSEALFKKVLPKATYQHGLVKEKGSLLGISIPHILSSRDSLVSIYWRVFAPCYLFLHIHAAYSM